MFFTVKPREHFPKSRKQLSFLRSFSPILFAVSFVVVDYGVKYVVTAEISSTTELRCRFCSYDNERCFHFGAHFPIGYSYCHKNPEMWTTLVVTATEATPSVVELISVAKT